MKNFLWSGLLVSLAITPSIPLAAQTSAESGANLKAKAEEVALDLVVRDKKGKPITDLHKDELAVFDNGTRQTLTSFRLVSGSEAISETGSKTPLDPLRQIRLVTLAFDSMNEPTQRKLAREAALDLINGEQGTNVFYSVVVINTRLLVLKQFTKDKNALHDAIEQATAGLAADKFSSESDRIQEELKRNLSGAISGAEQGSNLLSTAGQAANTAPGPNNDPLQATLAKVMLDMLRFDAGVASQGTRLSFLALKSMVQGLQILPGRKSVLYFTQGLYVGPELDTLFRNLISLANRANVTFYSVDTRGVMTFSQNQGAASALNGAANAAGETVMRTGGATTKDEVMSSDNAETSGRMNVQLAVRDLAESTGGFLIGDSNDLRYPLRRVNEEISTYYELTYKPSIEKYDGSFRKIKVTADRKDLVIHSRAGYFALPPNAQASDLETYEVPLLKIISDGQNPQDVEYRAGAAILQPHVDGFDVCIMAELPLHALQPNTDEAKHTMSVHFSLDALVKDSKGEVVQKLARDRSLQVTPDQLKMGNFLERSTVTLPPGHYFLESVVMDRESAKAGTQRSEFTVPVRDKGVAISSIEVMRSYTPTAKNLDPNEPFQFQGGSITPTLNTTIPRTKEGMLRLFFVVYKDAAINEKPTVEVEFLQNGKSLTKAPLPLPDADPQGRIPYVMTISAAAIPPGSYEIRAIARQGGTTSESKTAIKIEAM